MKPGQIIKKFKSKKGREVILRVIKKDDLNGLLKMINSIISENDFILLNKKINRKEEIKWLNDTINQIKKNRRIAICAVHNSKIIGNSTVSKGYGCQSHIGYFGITLMKDYREEGIGTKLINEIMKLSKKELKCKLIILEAYETNKRAQNLYKKVGFKTYGKLPQAILRRGKYISDIKMYKEL